MQKIIMRTSLPRRGLALALACAMLAGCSATNAAASQTAEAAAEVTASVTESEPGSGITQISAEYTERDLSGEWDAAAATTVLCTGNTATVTGGNVSATEGCITVNGEGVILLQGEFLGSVIINAPDQKVQLVLNGLSLQSEDGPAVWVQAADKVFITLAEGSQNSMADAKSYAQTLAATGTDEPNACLYSKADLTINGSGALEVTGNYNHGIYSKDELTITGGTLSITATNDGIKGKDNVAICGGKITINAGGDGIQSNNQEDATLGWVCLDGGELTITSGGDGIQAETVLQLAPQSLEITAGGGSAAAAKKSENNDRFAQRQGDGNRAFATGETAAPAFKQGDRQNFEQGMGGQAQTQPENDPTQAEPPVQPQNGQPAQTEKTTTTENTAETAQEETTVSSKGLKAGGNLLVNSGTIAVNSADDALHTNADCTVSGGYLTLATGDDGIHADGTLTVQGGSIEITTSYEGLEGHHVELTDGMVQLTATDDGVNANGGSNAGFALGQTTDADNTPQLNIRGGVLVVDAGGDGLDSNGSLTVSGGIVLVSGPTDGGNGALDTGTAAVITGGCVMAAGSTAMAVNFGSASTQGSWLASTGNQSGGTLLTLTDENGAVLLSWAPGKEYACVVLSCPAMEQGGSYTLSGGGSLQGAEVSGYGFAQSGSLNAATQISTVTLETLNTSDQSLGMGGMGGNGSRGDMGGMGGNRGQKEDFMNGTRPDGMSGATPSEDTQTATQPTQATGGDAV